MTETADEPVMLRRMLETAGQQHERDRATIAALQRQVGEYQREGQHQVRNILSVVRSIARRSVEEGETAETYQARLDSRLASFTNLQSQIARDPRRGVDLRALVDGELLAFGIRLDEQAHADGPPVRLEARPASILGLAFHELVRMAIEGGSSTGLDGQIDVRWLLAPGETGPRHLEIVWHETGRQPTCGARPAPDFGRDVVEQAVAYEVGGDVHLDITGDGLHCRFCLPMACLARPE